jgi:hypothetical protein
VPKQGITQRAGLGGAAGTATVARRAKSRLWRDGAMEMDDLFGHVFALTAARSGGVSP